MSNRIDSTILHDPPALQQPMNNFIINFQKPSARLNSNMKKTYYIYGLIDPRNDLPFYIGKGTINPKRRGVKYRRVQEHLDGTDTHNQFKTKVLNKILLEHGNVPSIIYNTFEDENVCLDLEKELIRKYGRRDLGTGCLTNLTDGGEGFTGRVKSPEERKKISDSRKLYYQTHPANFKGCKHTEETKKIMSEIQKELAPITSLRSRGRRHTPETKEKLRQINLGRKIPKEICHKFAHHGKDNCQSKSYLFISPNNDTFKVEGEFKKFVRDNKLSIMAFKKFLNKGTIPPPINPTHNKMTIERMNSTGWEVRFIQREITTDDTPLSSGSNLYI